MSNRLLRVRLGRVRRLGRALLKRVRLFGRDAQACKLYLRLGQASARLDALVDVFPDDLTVLDAVLSARLGSIGLNEQLDATLAALASRLPHKQPD